MIDTFRKLYPSKIKWSYISLLIGPRAINKRIDMFLINKEAFSAVIDSEINDSFKGSDHVPIELTLSFNKLK